MSIVTLVTYQAAANGGGGRYVVAWGAIVFGAIYHWYPKITGRMLNDTMGKFHFWVTFLGTYAIYYPMHYLGFMGVPRRYSMPS